MAVTYVTLPNGIHLSIDNIALVKVISDAVGFEKVQVKFLYVEGTKTFTKAAEAAVILARVSTMSDFIHLTNGQHLNMKTVGAIVPVSTTVGSEVVKIRYLDGPTEVTLGQADSALVLAWFASGGGGSGGDMQRWTRAYDKPWTDPTRVEVDGDGVTTTFYAREPYAEQTVMAVAGTQIYQQRDLVLTEDPGIIDFTPVGPPALGAKLAFYYVRL